MLADDFDQTFDQVVAEAVSPELHDQINDDLDLFTVGVDSLGLIRLIMRLEDELGIFWPVEQLAEHEKFMRVGELRRACRTFAAMPS